MSADALLNGIPDYIFGTKAASLPIVRGRAADALLPFRSCLIKPSPVFQLDAEAQIGKFNERLRVDQGFVDRFYARFRWGSASRTPPVSLGDFACLREGTLAFLPLFSVTLCLRVGSAARGGRYLLKSGFSDS